MAGDTSLDEARWGSGATEDGRQTVRIATVARRLAEAAGLPVRAAVCQVLEHLAANERTAYFIRRPGDYSDDLLEGDALGLLRVSGARQLIAAGFMLVGTDWWCTTPSGTTTKARVLPVSPEEDLGSVVYFAGDQLLKVARTPDLRGLAGLVDCLGLVWANVTSPDELDGGAAGMVAVLDLDAQAILGERVSVGRPGAKGQEFSEDEWRTLADAVQKWRDANPGKKGLCAAVTKKWPTLYPLRGSASYAWVRERILLGERRGFINSASKPNAPATWASPLST